ncbi:MAG: DUF4304 domain-containing protein [Planctomycetaceae bacterium]|nr:DUF4304 domain-containing protein [Planctomycetaceae bacterium]
MDELTRLWQIDQIAASIGDEAFNRLLGSLNETRKYGRLRFWQEDLLARSGVLISNYTQFLELFEGVKWRTTGRSKDALTAATRKHLIPILQEHGFRNYTKRSFIRVTNGCVFQYLGLELSRYGGKDFCVSYASMLITRLQDGVGSTTFRRLPRGRSNDGSWSAKSQWRADEAMQDVCEKTRNIALPWFDTTSSALGLAQELADISRDGNPHTFFELGCCYATAGHIAEAVASLHEATRLFQKSYDEMPQRTWALKERAMAEALLAAIADGTQSRLLSSWRDQSMGNLKLSSVCG